MSKYIKCEISNMCMVYNGDFILVIDRKKKDWPGISFPGGHLEDNESLTQSIIREVKEETGLDIFDPILCDIKEWHLEEGVLYLGLLYKTNKFKGEIISSEEGKVFWIKKEELNKYKLSQDFEELFHLIDDKQITLK